MNVDVTAKHVDIWQFIAQHTQTIGMLIAIIIVVWVGRALWVSIPKGVWIVVLILVLIGVGIVKTT